VTQSSPSLFVLDCTLRDGGYYNDWDFDAPVVARYNEVMDAAAIDIIEIGFRFTDKEGFLGPYAYSSDEWVGQLKLPAGATVSVMCNAKDLLESGDPDATVRALFRPAAESPVNLVRIAAHFRETPDCADAVKALHALGYEVGLNLMQTGGRSAHEIEQAIDYLVDLPLAVIYFADSLGNMTPAAVEATVHTIRGRWNGAIGFHAHDNMGNALANTLAAYRAGATWLDATVLGMGRGAGNLRLEYLLFELRRIDAWYYTAIDGLLDLVVNEFAELQKRYQWGPNLFYYLSALYEVHPTYVQEMLRDDRYGHDEVIAALQRLGNAGGARGYSPSRLSRALADDLEDAPGSWDCTGWLEGRDVLLVAAGDMGQRHQSAVTRLIRGKRPFVMCINSNPWIDPEDVDLWCSCHPQRLILDSTYYSGLAGTIVVPNGLIPADVRPALHQWTLLDYGVSIRSDTFESSPVTATIPKPLSALYALAFATAAGARRIDLVGFDGYSERDPRHREIEDGLQRYLQSGDSLALTALTPSTLQSVTHSSIYALGV